jgi:DNA-directed RNA polymerase subunit RPC12/RpoP
MQESYGQVPCTYHPDVMTGLRCNRCSKPICAKDAVRTPVGLRCPDCAGVRSLPSIRTSGDVLLKAVGGGILVAVLVAVLWRFMPDWGFYLSLALGFGVVETMAYLTRNKRGRDLQLAAILIVTGGLVLSRVLLAQRYGIDLGQLNELTPFVARALQLEAIPDLIYAGLAYAIAWIRFR